MSVTIYRSTDAGAPVLNGVLGSLIGLLDACLVNGYGAKASAGWTKEFAATNKAAYRQPIGSNRMYLYVDDSATTTNAGWVRFCGYESMSAINVGVNKFPTEVQLAGGFYSNKSATLNTTARPWMLVTNGKIFYLFIWTASANIIDESNDIAPIVFGDISSLKIGDKYATIIVGNQGYAIDQNNFRTLTGGLSDVQNHFMPRTYTQLGTSIFVGKHGDVKLSGAMGQLGLPYPHPVDNAIHISPVWIHELNLVRGTLPGLWVPIHAYSNFQQGQVIPGSGIYADKTFEAVRIYSSCCCFIETSNTW